MTMKIRTETRHNKRKVAAKVAAKAKDAIKEKVEESRTYPDVIQELSDRFDEHPHFEKAIVKSINVANEKAIGTLKDALYSALEWPTTSEEYLSFLDGFWQWIPVQSKNPAWTSPDNSSEQQECYDRLCHFYFLIDQPFAGTDIVAQSFPWFSKWLIDYASLWGSFLDTTDSISEETIQTFYMNSPEYRIEDSLIDGGRPNNPSGWLTFNQFFARRLNPGLRPISKPDDNRLVCCPADCTYMETFPIDANNKIPEITMKYTHRFASIEDLMDGSDHADAFKNGTYAHYFLNTFSYHHFHAPVSGTLVEAKAIEGKTYLEVHVTEGGDFDAPDPSQGGYEFNQSRGMVVYDTAGSKYGDIGKVAVFPVGMAQVSSVQMTATEGSEVLKGDEFGYFLFGGSDIIVLFEEKAKPHLFKNTHYRHYGTPIAICNPSSSS